MDQNQAVETKQYLTFKLGEDLFAVDVTKAREVLDLTTLTRVPQTPDFMLGVTNLRGSVVPVIDMRRKFGMPQAEATRDSCIVVMELEVEGEMTVIGALVDAVEEVLELPEDQIEPPPRIGTRLKTEFIKGMGSREGRFVIILAIEKVFSTDELSLVQDSCEEFAEA